MNALATYGPLAPVPTLDAVPLERTLASDDPPTHLWPVRRNVFESTYIEAEAAQDSRPLDVERLLQQAFFDGIRSENPESIDSDSWTRAARYASQMMAQYARLAAEKPHD